MPIANAKVYHDGSHYIAIPPRPNPSAKRKKKPKKYLKKIPIPATPTTDSCKQTESMVAKYAENRAENGGEEKFISVDLKKIFDEEYKSHSDKKLSEKRRLIIERFREYYQSEKETKDFVTAQLVRVKRNYIVRRTRLYRKVYGNAFNYFCTFTYDDKKHTEESFMKSLKICLKHLAERKYWKYIGVFERSPEKKRLHFHGIFHIPENAMIGTLYEKKDYSLKTHKMQTTVQNTHFNHKFGRCDFEVIPHIEALKESVQYLLKYIEKTGEKLMISKNVKTYRQYDVLDDDIICPIGQEERKVVLFDDHACFVEGEYIGQSANPETLNALPKCN